MGTNTANKISINCMEMIQQNLLVRLLTLLATLQGGILFSVLLFFFFTPNDCIYRNELFENVDSWLPVPYRFNRV